MDRRRRWSGVYTLRRMRKGIRTGSAQNQKLREGGERGYFKVPLDERVICVALSTSSSYSSTDLQMALQDAQVGPTRRLRVVDCE